MLLNILEEITMIYNIHNNRVVDIPDILVDFYESNYEKLDDRKVFVRKPSRFIL